MVSVPQEEQRSWFLGNQAQGFEELPEDQATWSVSLGPSPMGGYLRMLTLPGKVEVGPSLAPQMAPLIAHLDATLGLQIGPLTPARPMR